MIEVALLGTGGMMPLPGRWLSSLLMRVNGEVLLFDCGEGTQIAFRQFGWSFRHLSAICISHVHADHVAGLPGLLHAVASAGRIEPVDLFGPIGVSGVVRGLRVIAPILPFDLRIRELQGGATFSLQGGLRGLCASGEHSLPVLAYRVELPRRPEFLVDRARSLRVPLQLWRRLQHGETVVWNGATVTPDQVLGPPRPGLKLAYVTDTRPTRDVARIALDVDLIV